MQDDNYNVFASIYITTQVCVCHACLHIHMTRRSSIHRMVAIYMSYICIDKHDDSCMNYCFSYALRHKVPCMVYNVHISCVRVMHDVFVFPAG